MFGAVHPGDDVDDMFKFSYSEMPFASHEMTEELSKILENKGLKDDIDEIFNNDESIKHIDITTFIEKPVSPLVFDSLFRPIVTSGSKPSPQEWGHAGFWSNGEQTSRKVCSSSTDCNFGHDQRLVHRPYAWISNSA